MRVKSLLIALSLLVAGSAAGQDRREVFISRSDTAVHYRIPAIAALEDGTVVAVADYRFSRNDIGIVKDGRVDLRASVSHDDGRTWNEIITVVEGKGKDSPDFMNVGFGDPCIAADRESGRILLMCAAGNIAFTEGTQDCHLRITRMYSDDKGATWSAPEDITDDLFGLFDSSADGAAKSMFVTSGRIVQSRHVKTGKYYRLYCAVLQIAGNDKWLNYVLYSDDFGASWKVLGGTDVPPITDGANEAKVEELPDGDVVISSRTDKEGRMFNIFNFKNIRKATGSWGEMAHSSSHNAGVVTKGNSCNGELLSVPVYRKSDGQKIMLLLQSAPAGPRRSNVSIYYKGLDLDKEYSPEEIARDWEGSYRVTNIGSAYSVMAQLSDGKVGIMYEEKTYYPTSGAGYTLVYDAFTIDQITDGKYSLTYTQKPIKYNRGIGIYPGNPDEDFSPRLSADKSYRNLALNRTIYHSSSHDYCLTGQLIADGIAETSLPKYLTMETSAEKNPKREREWFVDQHPYTMPSFFGPKVYFEIALHNGWTEEFDRIDGEILVSYLEENADGSHEVRISASKDGKEWTVLKTIKGDELIGRESKPRGHSDPDKADALGNQLLPTRKFNLDVRLPKSESYSAIRVEMEMKGAEQWIGSDINFFNGEEQLQIIPSKHFNSTWMSLGKEQEWIYIDLGAEAAFDKIVLKWLQKPSSATIQVSDDAESWKDIAGEASVADLTETINAKGKGRYVRLLMQGDGKTPIMLTEMEVWGTGGLTATPKEAPAPSDNEMTLSGGNWKLVRANLTDAAGTEISAESFDDSRWLTATVPGTVLSSYINLGAVPDPNYADNIFQISDSYFNSDFWYRNEFELPESLMGEKLWLDFDGINWKAEIFMNGKYLGRIDGAFIRGRFDITDLAKEGTNTLAVRIIKNANPGSVKEKNENDTGRNGGILGYDNPTFHATIGWDWISTIRGRNIGIWNEVRIRKEGPVSLDAPYVKTILPLPDTTSAVLTPEVIAKNSSSKAVSGILRGHIGGIEFSKDVTLAPGEERNIIFDPAEYGQLNMKDPKLWWPNGYGEQNLYKADFMFEIDGKVSDRTDFNVGIRQVDAKEIDEVLFLYINGRRFVGRGGNWGFSENNLTYRAREYDIAVAYHADMNFTILRNWVGQIGDTELYEACDRYGIMVWQDFWLANPYDGPNPQDNAMFLANAEDLVKKIRRYPSMVIYCGRNEGFPPEELDNGLRQIIDKWHSDLYYIPSSADGSVSGHGPYRALTHKGYFTYKKGNTKFHSERGMPSVLTYESMLRTFAPNALEPKSILWGQHDYTLNGAQRASSFNEIIELGYGKAETAKEFSEQAQFVNYDGYKGMFESRSINRKGLLLWMSHPAWPSMTWQTYDWFLEPNASYFGCKKGAEPLHIQWNPAENVIEVVNYHGGYKNGLTAEALIMNMDGTVKWSMKSAVDSKEDSTLKCFGIEFPEELSEVHFIKLYLRKDGKVISDNFYINGKEYGNHQAMKDMAKAEVKSSVSAEMDADGTWRGTVTLENLSDVPAVMIRLNVVGQKDGEQILPMFYEDNYFSLMPGEKKTVSLKWYEADTRGNKPEVKISGYNL